MHPDDQFEAFQRLVEGGRGIEDVAARFGVNPAVVERRLKLAKVSPKLRAAFRKGELTLEQMMAFAVSDDHDLQEEVYRGLSGFRSSARDIRAALTQEAVALTHALAKFVTVEAYVASGGVIQRDLFDTANDGYMPDRVLVLQLAQAKLEASCATVQAEGWKWVKAEAERDYSVNYGRVYGDHEDAEDGDAEPIVRFDPEDMLVPGLSCASAMMGNWPSSAAWCTPMTARWNPARLRRRRRRAGAAARNPYPGTFSPPDSGAAGCDDAQSCRGAGGNRCHAGFAAVLPYSHRLQPRY
jgi:hypothetical protein